MKVHFVFPVLPPVMDGIGDHTAYLARTLAARCQVKIMTGTGMHDAVEGVTIEPAFSLQHPRSVFDLARTLAQSRPDWLIVQYNPFSYGRWGFNPYLPLAVQQVRRVSPQTCIGVIVHEPFVPVDSWRSAIMTVWQRWQLWMLGQQADFIFFSIEPWVQRFRGWFPRTRVQHLPVSSNLTYVPVPRQETRLQLGIDPGTLVLGVFGSDHPSRLLPVIRAASAALKAAAEHVLILYVGAAGAHIREVMGGIPVLNAGPQHASQASRYFAAMDLYLAPFRKGVSSRRSSFMAGLQHGIATVSTSGPQTDAMLRAQNRIAFRLAPDDEVGRFVDHALELARDAEERSRTAMAGRAFFEAHFTWDRIADALYESMAHQGRETAETDRYAVARAINTQEVEQ